MNRNARSDHKPLAAIGPQARELTESELDAVSGGTTVYTAINKQGAELQNQDKLGNSEIQH